MRDSHCTIQALISVLLIFFVEGGGLREVRRRKHPTMIFSPAIASDKKTTDSAMSVTDVTRQKTELLNTVYSRFMLSNVKCLQPAFQFVIYRDVHEDPM